MGNHHKILDIEKEFLKKMHLLIVRSFLFCFVFFFIRNSWLFNYRLKIAFIFFQILQTSIKQLIESITFLHTSLDIERYYCIRFIFSSVSLRTTQDVTTIFSFYLNKNTAGEHIKLLIHFLWFFFNSVSFFFLNMISKGLTLLFITRQLRMHSHPHFPIKIKETFVVSRSCLKITCNLVN